MLNVVRRIAKNTIVLMAAGIVSGILGFLSTMYAARYLGVTAFGVLSFAMAFAEIFIVFSDLGLNTLIVRDVAKDRSLARKYMGNILVLKSILIVLSFGFIVFILHILHYPQRTIHVVYLIVLSLIWTTFRKMFNSIFRAFEKMEYISMGDILNSLLLFLGILFAIHSKFHVVGFAFIYFIVCAFSLGYAIMTCMEKFVIPRIEMDWKFWKDVFRDAWPLGGMAVCIIIYFRIDTVMLSLMKGDATVGIYSVAFRLSEVMTVIPSIFISSVFPVMAKYHENSIDSSVKIYRKAIKYLSFLALPMALLITFLAKPIITIIYGNAFGESAVTLQILIWAAAIMYITMVLGTTFVVANKQLVNFKLTIIAVFLNIALNAILIPKYSYNGAAAATVITEVFGLFVGIFFLNRWGYKLDVGNICRPHLWGLSAAASSAAVLNMLGANVFMTSGVTLVLYGTVLYAMGIQEDDKRLIRNILSFSNA